MCYVAGLPRFYGSLEWTNTPGNLNRINATTDQLCRIKVNLKFCSFPNIVTMLISLPTDAIPPQRGRVLGQVYRGYIISKQDPAKFSTHWELFQCLTES